MKALYGNLPVATLCGLFGKSRQAWYDLQGRKQEDLFNEQVIVELVQQKRALLPKVGGIKLFSMLSGELADHHIAIGRDAFYAILRNNDLLVPCKRRYAVTTQSNHHFKKWPDLVQRRHPTRAEEIWVSDITYLRTLSGFIYLSLITDAFSRKIVGYHLSQSLKATGCITALNKAISGRRYPARSLIHHSDRGIQYCCDAYVKVLLDNDLQISMTQDGSPYDNAVAERVNGILKAEFDLYRTFDSYQAAIDPVCKVIAAYNTIRPHFSCDLQTPDQAHGREEENTPKVFSDVYMPSCQAILV
jgi:putative transposase